MGLDRILRKWSRFVAKYPDIILASIFVTSAIIIILTLDSKFPNFDEPNKGFEAKRTELSGKLLTWDLFTSTEDSNFVNNPLEYFLHLQEVKKKEKDLIKKKKRPKNHHNKQKKNNDVNMDNGIDQEHKFVKRDLMDNEFAIKSENHLLNYTGSFFCDHPNEGYSKIVVTSKADNHDLWSRENMLAMCYMDNALRDSIPYFSTHCVTTLENEHLCCRSWSPANYVALVNNKTSCYDITEDDLENFKSVISICQEHYLKGALTADCEQDEKCRTNVNETCYKNNDIYHLLEYILDYRFSASNSINRTEGAVLPTAIIMLPLSYDPDDEYEKLDIYKKIVDKDLSEFKDVRISALDLGTETKNALFNEKLTVDSIYMCFGMAFIVFCLWFYTKSFIITIGTTLSVIFSLGLSYFIYTFILNIQFFPFMNLLTVVVIVGIGSDDTFIFFKFWKTVKEEAMNSPQRMDLTQHVIRTMKNAVPAMFVTTITTAGAFLASIVSHVTAIDCFSVFSCLTVLVNFFFMITWLPACMVLAEKYELRRVHPEPTPEPEEVRQEEEEIRQENTSVHDDTNKELSNFLVKIIIKIRWFWFFLFAMIIVGSYMVVFKFPALRMPDTMDFQIFQSSHLFEQYGLVYANRFWFERHSQHTGQTLPLRFVWGVLPSDNTKRLDPDDRGGLVIDYSFNVSSPESQRWLLKFCSELKKQDLKITPGWFPRNCFIESMEEWLSDRECIDPVDKINNRPCCELSKLPYSPEIFTLCSAYFIDKIERTPYIYNGRAREAGPKFFRQNNSEIAVIYHKSGRHAARAKAVSEIRAMVIEFDSNVPYSYSFTEVDRFYTEMDTWMKEILRTAPPGMRNGYFVSELKFYALQKVLQDGTSYAIILALFVSLIVLGWVTGDMALSLCALASIGGAILSTIAITVLIGWKLNVLESIAISTAIGLATDFSLHYSVGYRENNQIARQERAKCTLSQFGGPTFMAALTTGVAGAFMLPSDLLAYSQIGLFLVIVMSVSWLYATFFLCSTLAIMGPTQFRKYFNSRMNLVEEGDANDNQDQNNIALNVVHNDGVQNDNFDDIASRTREESDNTSVIVHTVELNGNTNDLQIHDVIDEESVTAKEGMLIKNVNADGTNGIEPDPVKETK